LANLVIRNNWADTYAAALRWATNNGKTRKEFLDIIDALVDADIIEIVTDKSNKRSLAIA
jgi:hypothetical protein